MQERVRLVKDFLPDFVVEHPEMYSILSRGLHELSEDECLSHFEALKTAIFIIAEDRLVKLKQVERNKQASKAISAITSGLKS